MTTPASKITMTLAKKSPSKEEKKQAPPKIKVENKEAQKETALKNKLLVFVDRL